MTIAVQAITPSNILSRYSLSGVSKVASATTMHGLSKDRNWHHGSGTSTNKNVLRLSYDDCTTYSDIHTFNYVGGNVESVLGLIELADGEVLVATSGGSGVPTYLYKSSGWGTTLAQHQAATWSAVPFATRGGGAVDVWGFNQKCVDSDGWVTISVYAGGQTASGSDDATQATRARYVYQAKDNGQTFNLIYDLYMQPQAPTPGGVHIHSVTRIPEWKQTFVLFGDSTGAAATIAGAGNMFVAVINDEDGAISYLAIPTLLTNVVCQFTSIVNTSTSIIFVHDGQAYNQILTMPKAGYRTFGVPHIHPLPSSLSPVGKSISRAAPGLPLIAGYNTSLATTFLVQPEILISPDDFNWYPLYIDTAPASGASAFAGAITGPSLRNKIVAVYETGYLTGTLVAPS